MSQIEQVVKQIKSEFRVDSEGKVTVSIRGAARLAGVGESDIIDTLEETAIGNIPEPLIFLGRSEVQSYSVKALNGEGITDLMLSGLLEFYALDYQIPWAYAVWKFFFYSLLNPNYKIMSIKEATQKIKQYQPNATPAKKKKLGRIVDYQEARICKRLKAELNCKTEVSTPSGRIDLLTEKEIIEVKAIEKWKDGVGQLMAYQSHYPNHTKRLHLFGSSLNLPDIKFVCSSLEILVTVEPAN